MPTPYEMNAGNDRPLSSTRIRAAQQAAVVASPMDPREVASWRRAAPFIERVAQTAADLESAYGQMRSAYSRLAWLAANSTDELRILRADDATVAADEAVSHAERIHQGAQDALNTDL